VDARSPAPTRPAQVQPTKPNRNPQRRSPSQRRRARHGRTRSPLAPISSIAVRRPAATGRAAACRAAPARRSASAPQERRRRATPHAIDRRLFWHSSPCPTDGRRPRMWPRCTRLPPVENAPPAILFPRPAGGPPMPHDGRTGRRGQRSFHPIPPRQAGRGCARIIPPNPAANPCRSAPLAHPPPPAGARPLRPPVPRRIRRRHE
jgi:hypothetical protein